MLFRGRGGAGKDGKGGRLCFRCQGGPLLGTLGRNTENNSVEMKRNHLTCTPLRGGVTGMSRTVAVQKNEKQIIRKK